MFPQTVHAQRSAYFAFKVTGPGGRAVTAVAAWTSVARCPLLDALVAALI